MRRYREKTALNKPRKEVSEETELANTLTSDFWLPEL
jgi:hypothetical protein